MGGQMKVLALIINFLEILLYISLPLFIASTLYLISVVKKSNYKLIKDAVTNPIIPNIDLRFFGKLQNEFLKIRKNGLPPLVNKVSFYIIIIGFILLFILVVMQEMFSN
jgi:hypothetical protein